MRKRTACLFAALFVVGCAETPTAPKSEFDPQYGLHMPKLKLPKLKMPKLKLPKLKPPKEPKHAGATAFELDVFDCTGAAVAVSGEYLLEVEGEPDITSGRVTVWATAGGSYEFTARTGRIVFEEIYPGPYVEAIPVHLHGNSGQLLGTLLVTISIAEDGEIGTTLDLVGLCAK